MYKNPVLIIKAALRVLVGLHRVVLGLLGSRGPINLVLGFRVVVL